MMILQQPHEPNTWLYQEDPETGTRQWARIVILPSASTPLWNEATEEEYNAYNENHATDALA